MLDLNIKVVFANVDGEFSVSTGSTISREYSETLDSAVIIVRSDSKLNINPYDEVKIIINDNVSFCMLIDNYSSQIEEFDKKSFLYNINLMSLTKYLEKIQLPNRIITHSLVDNEIIVQKTILEYIKQYMELYIPKIKTITDNNGWEYTPLIKMKEDSYYEIFNVKCRDMQFSQLTLREVLTNLMLQVGCIPVVIKDGAYNVLSFLNFRKEPKGVINYDKLDLYGFSNSSDSYVNSLTTMSDNILDDNNSVLVETLGFRDAKNVFLKQQENLKLMTRFPIYKVDKLYANLPCSARVAYKSIQGLPNVMLYFIFELNENDFSSLFLRNHPLTSMSWENYYDYIQLIGKMYFIPLESTNGFLVFENAPTQIVDINETIYSETQEIQASPYSANQYSVVFKGVAKAKIKDEDTIITADLLCGNDIYEITTTLNILGFIDYNYKRDITSLCVENKKRSLLDTDFLSMRNETTVEGVSKYIYGTVGYDIGGKEITGFSQMYNKAVGWWKNNYTYYENILDILKLGGKKYYINEEEVSDYSNDTDEMLIHLNLLDLKDDLIIRDANFSFTYFYDTFFTIEYKPLNTLRLNFTKDTDIPLEFTQLDTKENAISSFNELATVETQKINRLGNEILSGSRRYDNKNISFNILLEDEWFSMFYKLDGGEIVFKQEIAFDKYYTTENITASKNHILQNYFTSIQTKYRAYQYIDYGQAIIRKENTKVYGLIDRYNLVGYDTGVFIDPLDVLMYNTFFTAINSEYSEAYKINYAVVSATNNYQNDLSILKYKNGLIFSTELFDSASYGLELIPIAELEEALGGYQQSWYIIENFDTLRVGFANIEYQPYIKDEYRPEITQSELLNALPLLKTFNEDSVKIWLTNRNYYLDQQEKLNQALQFEFYTTDSGILWTEKMWELSGFNGKYPYGKKYIYLGKNETFGINDNSYTEIDTTKLITYDNTQIAFGASETGGSGFQISWNLIGDVDFIKFVYEEDGKYYDLMAITKTENLDKEWVYMSLNRTKTIKVADYEKGILSFNKYKCKVNTLNREVETI